MQRFVSEMGKIVEEGTPELVAEDRPAHVFD